MAGAFVPACGADGMTYDAACGVECVPVEVACLSECPCPETSSMGTASSSTDGSSDGTTAGDDLHCDETRVTCEVVAPNCAGSTVPEIMGECYTGNCAELADCPGFDPLANCEGCPPQTECVSWSECVGDSCGLYAQSCNEVPPDCTAGLTCDCGGTALCQGVGNHSCFDMNNDGIFCCRGDLGVCSSAGG